MEVSLVELRAWARASKLLAEREGFPLVAERVGAEIDRIELMMRCGNHTVVIMPKEGRCKNDG